jgi:hypothetical protein
VHWQCQSIPGRFEEWERDAGHRSEVFLQNPAEFREKPGMVQRATNFAGALWEHTLDGFAEVDDAEYERRLVICRACPLFDPETVVCRHPDCGCLLERKARWASSRLSVFEELNQPELNSLATAFLATSCCKSNHVH